MSINHATNNQRYSVLLWIDQAKDSILQSKPLLYSITCFSLAFLNRLLQTYCVAVNEASKFLGKTSIMIRMEMSKKVASASVNNTILEGIHCEISSWDFLVKRALLIFAIRVYFSLSFSSPLLLINRLHLFFFLHFLGKLHHWQSYLSSSSFVFVFGQHMKPLKIILLLFLEVYFSEIAFHLQLLVAVQRKLQYQFVLIPF